MNATGKQLIAFWLHRKGEHWTLQSVDKQSTPEVGRTMPSATFQRFSLHFRKYHRLCKNAPCTTISRKAASSSQRWLSNWARRLAKNFPKFCSSFKYAILFKHQKWFNYALQLLLRQRTRKLFTLKRGSCLQGNFSFTWKSSRSRATIGTASGALSKPWMELISSLRRSSLKRTWGCFQR